MQTSFELAVALAGPRGACRILRVESTPLDGTTRRVDGVCAEVRRKMIQFTGKLDLNMLISLVSFGHVPMSNDLAGVRADTRWGP